MALIKIHPLEMPELVFHIGCFISLEEKWLLTNNWVRHSKTLSLREGEPSLKIAKEGWTASLPSVHMEREISRLEKFVWDRVFEQVRTCPQMHRLNLGRAQFFKKGRAMN
ncbi:hypothetical protein BGZ92_006651 [Podila epicladia]|nr:hypothetical protein BGZ92_006651 [Podila epicladia]